MGNVISNLKAKFGVDSSDFKKGLKDGEQATADFKGAAGGMLDEFASMFGVNMSAVNDSIGTAHKSLNFMAQSFKGAATSSNILSIALKVLKFAIVATGIGAIVVLLGSLIAYFQKSGEGSDKFARILAQIKSVINNTIERLAIFGKGLYQLMTGKFKEGWETMRSAFKGIGDELKEDWKAAGDLADREDALEDREIALINSLEERRAKAAELRLAAKEEMDDQNKKLDLLNKAEALTKSVYGDQLSLERERLAIMKEKLAIQTKDPTDEQRREIAEQEAKINGLLREQAQELKGIVRERNSAKAAVEAEAFEIIKAQNQIAKVDISHLELPNLAPVLAQIQLIADKTKEVTKAVGASMIDVSDVINQALIDVSVGFGKWIGEMETGMATTDDLIKMVGQVLGGMLTQLGEVLIAEGIGLMAIKKGLQTVNPYVAIAAGVALVALGASITSYLGNMSKGLGSTSSSSIGGSNVYDSSPYTVSRPSSSNVNISGKVELVAKGKDLVAVLDAESQRVYTNA
jgi:hypothetical protein